MTVDTTRATVEPVRRDGKLYWFCSDGCRDRFLKQSKEDDVSEKEEMALDPVCGMTIPKATAAATREHDGKTYYFCMEGCAKSFEAAPDRYLTKAG